MLILCVLVCLEIRSMFDIEISADGNKTLFEAHEIAEHVHDAIERNFPKVKHVYGACQSAFAVGVSKVWCRLIRICCRSKQGVMQINPHLVPE